VDTRLNVVYFLLKKNGITVRLPKDEMPIVEEEPAVAYSDDEMKMLFGGEIDGKKHPGMSKTETVNGKEYTGNGFGPDARYRFFLGTACRDQEVTYASWRDVNFNQKEFTVRGRADVGFTPKSHESRTIPLPTSLVALLKQRRANAPDSRWIFVNEEGRPDNHFVRKLKVIAKNAGMNCGHCKHTVTKGRWHRKTQEVTCETDPVCDHIYLQRFRKTCATRWVEMNVPLPKIQKWLGHKDLNTTQKYLGDIADSKYRDNVDKAYGD
jgi:integrase